MRHLFTILAIAFATVVYSRQITPVTNAGYTSGLPMDFASTPNEVYLLCKLNGGSSADTMRYAVDKFDGNVWSQVLYIALQPGAELYCIQFWNNKLILGGMFHNLFGIPGADGVIAYSNGAYEALGSGISTDAHSVVHCLEVYQNKLLAGGQLFMTTGSSCHPLAQFDGVSWSNLGGAFNNPLCLIAMVVENMKAVGDRLYLQGEFEYADNMVVNNVAYFENGTYHPMGDGFPAPVVCPASGIGVAGDKVFMNVIEISQIPVLTTTQKLMMWNGTNWSAIMTEDSTHAPVITINSSNGVAVFSGGSWNTAAVDAVFDYENALEPFTGLQDYSYFRDAFTLNNEVYFMGQFKLTGDNNSYTFGKTTVNGLATGIVPQAESITEVYPNPFSNNIAIRTTETVESVRLTDLSGRNVYETQKPASLSSISTGNLPMGVYFLDIKTAEGVIQRKLLKSN